MRSRVEFPAMCQALGLTGTMVEVGTYRGAFAKNILDGWPGHLICVDAWHHNPQAHDILNHDQPTMDECYRFTLEYLQPYEHRCEVIRAFSVDAAQRFSDAGEVFDVVYLDAGHDYDNIRADIAAWWPLVKPGGILSGHDYLDATVADGYPADFGVKTAVTEFAVREHLAIFTTTDDVFPTWWVFKP